MVHSDVAVLKSHQTSSSKLEEMLRRPVLVKSDRNSPFKLISLKIKSARRLVNLPRLTAR